MSKRQPPEVSIYPGAEAKRPKEEGGGEPSRFNWDEVIPPRLFHEVVEQASSAISITDEHANIIYANPAFERTTGHQIEHVLGKNEAILSSRLTPDVVYEALWARIKSGAAWNGLLLNKREDNSNYVADLTISPVSNAAGQVTNFLGVHRDVTDIYELKHQVLNQKKLIETVVDSAPFAVSVLSPDHSVLLDNLSYKTIKADFDEEPAQMFMRCVASIQGERFEDNWRRRRSFQDLEIEIEQSSGSRWFSCSGIWFHQKDASAEYFFDSQQNDFLLLVVNEVTRYKEQQKAVRMSALRALMAEQEHEEEMREAMAGAIFQLQAPLNLIGAAYGILARKGELPPELQPLNNVLQDAISKGRVAMENLRNSMPDALKEQQTPTNVNELVRDTLSMLTDRLLSSGIVVDWLPERALPNLNAQPSRLRSAFKQIIDNAIDAMDSGETSNRELTIRTRSKDGCIEMVVMDTGSGIPEDIRLKAFEPFFTTKGARANGGMGLTLVQAIVADHHGSVMLENGPTGGGMITIRLPREGSG